MCAIHQPNPFPRLATLAKLAAADYWIVLDDVQFARRDYQHRACLADLSDPARVRWLSIATHLPYGRATQIRDARLAEPTRCRRRVAHMLANHYRNSPYWPAFREQLQPLLTLFEITDRLAAVAEASTKLLLTAVGWSGQVLHSSELPAQNGRSERLADLARFTGARTYLCGTGGMRYLDRTLFGAIDVLPSGRPGRASERLRTWAGREGLSAAAH